MAIGTTAAILGGAIIASGAASATSGVIAGRQQAKSISRQGEYNAQVMEQQATMVTEQKKLQDYQANRAIARARSTIISRTAGKGLGLSGSPLAILIDNESQMLLDKAVGDYNLDVQKNYATSGANYYRQTGAEQSRLAKFTGYSNAFTTALNTAGIIGRL